jgi:hypothetical protein
LYDAGNLATEVEDAVKTLSDIIRDVQVTEGFAEVLDEKQLDDVYCAALGLSTAVVEYLAKAIDYFKRNKRGTCILTLVTDDFKKLSKVSL